MKNCNSKKGKSFLDLYDFLNKSLASFPETIHSLELELYQMDRDFSLNILPEEEWKFPTDHPVLTQVVNHTIFVREDFYNSAMNTAHKDGLILVHEFIHYLYLSGNYKNFI